VSAATAEGLETVGVGVGEGLAQGRIDRAWAVLATVLDPEVPALSVCDLGIVREVREVRKKGERLQDAEPRAGQGAAGSTAGAGGAEGSVMLEIVLTPTYSGCPATEVIERDVLAAIAAAGLGSACVRLQRAPAWTTDWISMEGRRKLKAYGIAPPGPTPPGGVAPLRFMPRRAAGLSPVPTGTLPSGLAAGQPEARSSSPLFHPAAGPIACPRCDSPVTERLSAFGSTACKALYRCLACREPFEHFKPI
jgi:ring-1,2-phenylacetyl-CoA epoxidase subunit PaaD